MADEKNYITPQGHAAIEAEFHELLKVCLLYTSDAADE